MTKKEQAIVEQLSTIPEFTGLYELFQEKLRIEDLSQRCKELRFVLERVISLASKIAGFTLDKAKITLKLDALKEHIPSELLNDKIKDAFAQANTCTRKYNHDREQPESEDVVQKDVDLAIMFLCRLFEWLIVFKDACPKYIQEHGPLAPRLKEKQNDGLRSSPLQTAITKMRSYYEGMAEAAKPQNTFGGDIDELRKELKELEEAMQNADPTDPDWIEHKDDVEAYRDLLLSQISCLSLTDEVLLPLGNIENYCIKNQKGEGYIHNNGQQTSRRYSNEELFACLVQLSEDNLIEVLSGVDCTQGVYNSLYNSVIHKNLRQFSTAYEMLNDRTLHAFYSTYKYAFEDYHLSDYLETLDAIPGDNWKDEGLMAVEAYLDSFDGSITEEAKRLLQTYNETIEENDDWFNADNLRSFIAQQDSLYYNNYKYILSSFSRLKWNKKEQEIIDSVIDRPSGRDYYKRYLKDLQMESAHPSTEEAPVLLCWPTMEELASYKTTDQSAYYRLSIFGSSSKATPEVVSKLHAFLVEEGMLDNTIESKLLLLSRFSGKIIPNLTMDHLLWKGNARTLGYFAIKVANHDFESTARFFKYLWDGARLPVERKIIAEKGHDVENLKRTYKEPFREHLDAALENGFEG